MKKFIITLLLIFIGSNFCFADELRLDKEIKYQKKLMETGFRILNANQIDKRVTFRYATKPKIKAKSRKVTKRVVVYKGLFPFIDENDELAAILSRNIALTVDAYGNPFKRIGTCIFSKKYSKKADLKAVDYMVNAGYSPVALIVIFNKFLYEPNWYDFGNVDTKGSTRMLRIYEYILNNYPQYLVENEFENNVYYQNFLITTKKEREKIGLKYQKNNTKKETSLEKIPVNE